MKLDYHVWHSSNKESNTINGKTTQKHTLKHIIQGSPVLNTLWRETWSHRSIFLGPQPLGKVTCILFIYLKYIWVTTMCKGTEQDTKHLWQRICNQGVYSVAVEVSVVHKEQVCSFKQMKRKQSIETPQQSLQSPNWDPLLPFASAGLYLPRDSKRAGGLTRSLLRATLLCLSLVLLKKTLT